MGAIWNPFSIRASTRKSMMRHLGKFVLLACAYSAAGSLGQFLAIPPGNVPVVWPASGVALAAVLLWGDRLWPNIWLGSLLVNVRMLFDPSLGFSRAGLV
jgi:integral membrane sensor domain MASE1